MAERRSGGCSRRDALVAVAVGGGIALGSKLAAAPAVSAQRSSIGGGGGIAGGGVVETPHGEAQFSVFATGLMIEGEEEPVVFGRVQWVDPSWRSQGLALESTAVTSYGPPADDETAREVRGVMTANGEGSYPFVLRVVDGGPPGFLQDTIWLVVGPGAVVGTPTAATPTGDLAYAVEGTIVGGDVQLLDFETENQG